MIETIENKILVTLQQAEMFKGMEIEPFPEDFDHYNFISELGCLLVRYDGSNYSEPTTLVNVTQEETYEFSVIVGIRYQDNLQKNYPVLDEIKRVLTGVRIREGKLYPKKRKFLGQKDRTTYYGYVFAITLQSFEEMKPDNVIEMFS